MNEEIIQPIEGPAPSISGPAPWQSKEVLALAGLLITFIFSQSGITLTAEDLRIILDALIGLLGAAAIFFRLFKNQGPIDWSRLTKR